jgi:hypothetical protein
MLAEGEGIINEAWEGLPKPGTRVRVPFLASTKEGVVAWLYRLHGDPVAQVRVRVPSSWDPDETEAINVCYRRGEIEVISD